ncbi:MAG: alpha/beta hydrolase [Actinomycetota bacterium]|nr:alpha/beta hydrolase [Actinomycetota bacterium]
MGITLIVLFVVVAVILAASILLGRDTREVESARDTEYLELEGVWIRYRVIGGGPAVVLVHGWLSSSRIWEQLAARLAQRFTVYTLDLSGFGESDKPLSGYGIRIGSRLLYALCAHFGLTRANVIGHDLGGAMAVKLAADHPDVVGRLVVISTPADENQIDLPTMLWLVTLPVVGPIFYALGRVARPVRRLWMRPFVADADDLTEEVVDDAGRSTPAAVSKTLSIARREIARGRLARQARIIKIPMLVVSGEEDQIVDPQSVGVWAGGVDNAEICLIDECGHLPMIERVAEFNAHILAFLTGDARYLDHVFLAPETKEVETHYVGEGEEEGSSTQKAGPSDDTTDLVSPGTELESVNVPRVVRKHGGRYPARIRTPQEYSDAVEEQPTSEGRARREHSGEDFLPELPDDLFDWPETRREFGPRERPEDGLSDGEDDDTS